jgi:glycosyltransferase involved in cell wall biosynthesis
VHLIHARSRAPAWSAFFAARLLKIPFVTTYHGIYTGSSRLKIFYNSIMARGNVVIANSAYTASLIRNQYPFACSAVHTIPRGTDFRLFSPLSVTEDRVQRIREAWGVDPSHRIIVVPARLTAWKGHRTVIEGARRLRDLGLMDSTRIVFAGDAQGRVGYVAELEERIRSAGLEGLVRIVGHCSDMPAALKAAHSVVVASVEPEAFGRVAVEAQAMGKPLVVSDLGAVSETVRATPDGARDDFTGWKVPPGDPDHLAYALKDILALSEEQTRALAQRARAHVERMFSVELMVEKTLEVYRRLLLPEGGDLR